jgi:hypothetical protein
MVLIEWIEQLHSSPNVNVIRCMPRFVTKFLAVIDSQETNNQPVTELGVKAHSQLKNFLDDFTRDGSSRSISLDKDVLQKLVEFLMKVDENKKVTLYCSLQWLNVFIGFL